MGIFVVDGQARASIVFVVMSRGLCPRSWVIRESSARGARAKILVYVYIYIYIQCVYIYMYVYVYYIYIHTYIFTGQSTMS